jgi:MFS family permease
MLILLMVILVSNYVDRTVLSLLLQSIKVDLALSDTQLGLLSGIAFTLFYAVVGIPIARWADRGNRVLIISLATTIWSVAVALCGAAAAFVHLLIIRVCVGVGEAGLAPPAHSLIADFFNRSERPRAVSTFKLGVPISLIIGYLGAGWLNELFGWRLTFVLLGLPGLFLGVLAWFTLREPRATGQRKPPPKKNADKLDAAADGPTTWQVVHYLAGNSSFRLLIFAYALVTLFGTGISKWQPAFFIRTYGISTGELGSWLALMSGGGALIGTFLGGYLATRYAANDERLQLRTMAFAYAAFGFIYMGIFIVQDIYWAFALMGLASIGGNIVVGPLFAMTQSLVPGRMRATALAIMYLVANLIGGGLGPLSVGILSDALFLAAGQDSLRIALALLAPGFALSGLFAWRASRTINADLAAVQQKGDGETA